MTVQERRWKWVRPECKPKDLYDLEVKLGHIKVEAGGRDEEDEEEKRKPKEQKEIAENITVIQTRDELKTDFSVTAHVINTLELLLEEKIKGKANAQFHVQVLSLMADNMKTDELSEKILKFEVLNLLISALFTTSKLVGFLSRDQWLLTHRRVGEIIDLFKD